MITALLLFGFLTFLFSLFSLSREDYILARKKAITDNVFNISFVGFVIAVLSARIFFVVFHLKWAYANPLVFFLFPYFPGLSLAGGIIGSLLFLKIITQKYHMPFMRIVDIFSLSFLISFSASTLVNQLLVIILREHMNIFDRALPVIDFVSFFFFLRLFRTNRSKDGLVGTLIVLFLSTTFMVKDLVVNFRHIQQSFGEDGLMLLLIVVSTAIVLASTMTLDGLSGKKRVKI